MKYRYNVIVVTEKPKGEYMAKKYKQEVSAKSGKTIPKGTAKDDKDTTYTRTVKRRHKLTVIFDLMRESASETDIEKQQRLQEQAQEKLAKLKPQEKAQMIEIAGALYHEASVATDTTKE